MSTCLDRINFTHVLYAKQSITISSIAIACTLYPSVSMLSGKETQDKNDVNDTLLNGAKRMSAKL